MEVLSSPLAGPSMKTPFEATDEEEDTGYVEDEEPQSATTFTLGMDSSTDRLHELQFSLLHHSQNHQQQQSPLQPDANGGSGHHASASREDSALGGDHVVIAEEIENLARTASQRNGHSAVAHRARQIMNEQQQQLQQQQQQQDSNVVDMDDFTTDFSSGLGITQVDSAEVVYDNRRKKPKILKNYIMGEVLGEGSFAKVKEAMEIDTLTRRAIKIMKLKKIRKIPGGEESVEKEKKLMKRLNHPNVLKMIDEFRNEVKGKVYLVMEFCCCNLKDMLDEAEGKRFPPWQAHDYFGQTVVGLQYLHSSRVVHKDIKPGNLLLCTDGLLKIADFGTADVLDDFLPEDAGYASKTNGTPAFQAPEIADGAERINGYLVDVWACGVTLYNFVTGKYPFDGDTIFRLFDNISNMEAVVPKDVDPVLTNLIEGMLTKVPSKRLRLFEVARHDWLRKKHPRTCPPVTMRPRAGDPTLSTTVIPFLCEHHYGEEVDEENNGGGGDYVTEHELNEMDRRRQEELEKQKEQQQQPKAAVRSKTTKCGPKNCVIS